MRISLLFFFIISTSCFSQTEFIFIKDTVLKGDCFERDIKTQGKAFSLKVNRSNCKPEQTSHSFNYDNGHCFIVDSKTAGKQYIEKVKTKECMTENSVYEFYKFRGKSACYHMDKPTSGQAYYMKVDNKLCDNEEPTYKWQPSGSFRGKCLIQETNAGKIVFVTTKDTNCRPSKVSYLFDKGSDFFRGNCFEIHPKGEARYSKKVSKEKCKPSETVYIFHTPEGRSSGKCFEIDSLSKGEKYIDTVDAKHCRNAL